MKNDVNPCAIYIMNLRTFSRENQKLKHRKHSYLLVTIYLKSELRMQLGYNTPYVVFLMIPDTFLEWEVTLY